VTVAEQVWCERCAVHHQCETDHGPDGHGGSSICCPLKRVVRQEWDADYRRRREAGQVGWKNTSTGSMWDLTPFNSKSFDNKDYVAATYVCEHCNGVGKVIG
jgi:hypothetical protein